MELACRLTTSEPVSVFAPPRSGSAEPEPRSGSRRRAGAPGGHVLTEASTTAVHLIRATGLVHKTVETPFIYTSVKLLPRSRKKERGTRTRNAAGTIQTLHIKHTSEIHRYFRKPTSCSSSSAGGQRSERRRFGPGARRSTAGAVICNLDIPPLKFSVDVTSGEL